jgi:hypothetical protein
MTEDDVLQMIEARSQAQLEAVRVMLIEANRPDLLKDLDRKIRDIRLGLNGARATWSALSEAQRRSVLAMQPGRKLVREAHSDWYVGIGRPSACGRVCHQRTARNLIARELVDLEGGAFDPERVLALSDRGRFVLAHGRGVNS